MTLGSYGINDYCKLYIAGKIHSGSYSIAIPSPKCLAVVQRSCSV